MNQRFYSLDVFRGATVCLMILVNNPGYLATYLSTIKTCALARTYSHRPRFSVLFICRRKCNGFCDAEAGSRRGCSFLEKNYKKIHFDFFDRAFSKLVAIYKMGIREACNCDIGLIRIHPKMAFEFWVCYSELPYAIFLRRYLFIT